MNVSDKPALRSFQKVLAVWFGKAGRDLPWRRTRDPDPYAITVSEFMCQQTQVVTVLPFFGRWMARFPNVTALAEASEHDVLQLWQGLGYYRRAKNLHRLAKTVVTEHVGKFPKSFEALRALPGVGDYTAGAVASFAFDLPVPAIDANVLRVTARLLDLQLPVDEAAGRKVIEQTVREWMPKKGARIFNSAIMELGALVCLPRNPTCGKCPVRSFCKATHPAELPIKAARKAVVRMDEVCGFVVKDAKFLLQQETGPRWNGLCKLPPAKRGGRVLMQSEYPFTHHRVTLTVVPIAPPRMLKENQRWFSTLDDAPMPAPHRRALAWLLAVGQSP